MSVVVVVVVVVVVTGICRSCYDIFSS